MKYRHLFFDLDGTLWDLHTNTYNTLGILFERYADHGLNAVSVDHFFPRYMHHNGIVWALYREGKMEKDVLRTIRFERAFHEFGFTPGNAFIDQFATDFLSICPKQPVLVPGARELLDHVHGRYHLHIITNGFKEVQGFKMEAGKISHYFSEIINSEDAGVKKPDPGIFRFALDRAGADAKESLMIGDDWEADILGARDFGMDQVFLSTHDSSRHNYRPTLEIGNLFDLIDHL